MGALLLYRLQAAITLHEKTAALLAGGGWTRKTGLLKVNFVSFLDPKACLLHPVGQCSPPAEGEAHTLSCEFLIQGMGRARQPSPVLLQLNLSTTQQHLKKAPASLALEGCPRFASSVKAMI